MHLSGGEQFGLTGPLGFLKRNSIYNTAVSVDSKLHKICDSDFVSVAKIGRVSHFKHKYIYTFDFLRGIINSYIIIQLFFIVLTYIRLRQGMSKLLVT